MRRNRLISLGGIALLASCAGGEAVVDDTSNDLRQRRCATKEVTEAELEAVEAKLDKIMGPSTQAPERQPGSEQVRVFAHVILASAPPASSNLDEQIQAQIDVLNATFAGRAPDADGNTRGTTGHDTAFRFTLAGVDTTINPAWAHMSPDTKEERDAKTALRQGGPRDLNIYIADIGDSLLGWSTFPWWYADDPVMDGVVILTSSLPGSVADHPYTEGDTAVHEVGHWLGLYHTFQGGCSGEDVSSGTVKGDKVKDTPRIAGPTFGCPSAKVDTCTYEDWSQKDDMTWNVMDYTDDRCMFALTHGQSLRMNWAWKLRASECGNGQVDLNESCDTGIADGEPGACPRDCDDDESCTTDVLVGAGSCNARCEHTEIDEPKNNDGCCPAGGNAGNDNDCSASCGDGVVSAGETCDKAIPAGQSGACPTSCSDGMSCTKDSLSNAGTCTAVCKFDPITSPSPISDGCCPSSGNANNDADCEAECGNGIPEPGEECDDGNDNDGDACTNSCTAPVLPTGMRITSLALVDPHVFAGTLLGCLDGTGLANDELSKNLTGDKEPDGFLDLSPVVVFTPFTTSETVKPKIALNFAECTAPASSTTCTAGEQEFPAEGTNQASGTCLSPITGTTNSEYSAPNIPANQCFVTKGQTIVITLQGANITLYNARIAAKYKGTTGLETGLLSGFVTEADAATTIVPLPDLAGGAQPLAKLLRGGVGNCKDASPAKGDKDTGPNGESGWYFYLNFTASAAPYSN